MLNGAKETKIISSALEPQNPASLKAFIAQLEEPQDPNQDLNLRIVINGDMTPEIAQRLCAKLPTLRISCFKLEIKSTQSQPYFSNLIQLFVNASWSRLILQVDTLDRKQLDALRMAVRNNKKITSFALNSTYIHIEETKKEVHLKPDDPLSLQLLDELLIMPQDPDQEYSLEVFVSDALTEQLAEKLCAILPRLRIASFILDINSFRLQPHFSKLIPLFARVNWTSLALAVNKLDATQVEALLNVVKNNPNITSFSLEGTHLVDESDTNPRLTVFNDRLQAWSLAEKRLKHLGLKLSELNTETAARILNLLGPLGLESLDFSRNNTDEKAERFDLLCAALLNPKTKLTALHLTTPFGGEPGDNQTKLFCDTLAKIPHNFDLHLTFPATVNLTAQDFVLLREALFINPRLCIYLKGFATKLKPFQEFVDAIARLSNENYRIRTLPQPLDAIRQRYDSLVLSGYGGKLKDLAITKEVSAQVPSLQYIVARFIARNPQRFNPETLQENYLEQFPTSSFTQYYAMLEGLQNLSLNPQQDQSSTAVEVKAENPRRDILLRTFNVPSV